jgi:hypothetical protein
MDATLQVKPQPHLVPAEERLRQGNQGKDKNGGNDN